MNPEVRFFATADSRFFIGVAAVLNSLRLSGNTHPAYVVDLGLAPDQRERLATMADLLTLPGELQSLHPMLTKTTADLFWSDGIVVLLDSDMIITSSLDDLIDEARAGKIAVHPDHRMNISRQFPEWAAKFGLQAPFRPQRYVNSVPMAISLDRWPTFLERWRRACLSLPEGWNDKEAEQYGAGDQDALNAILMSEISADDLWIGSEERTVHADGLSDVEIVDLNGLACTYRGQATVVLHYGASPKAWERRAWSRVRPDDAFIRLLPRLLFARDVPIRAKLTEVPIWSWPWGIGHGAAVGVHLLFLVGLLDLVRHLRDGALYLRDRLFGMFS